ncbi:hypothetical protein [Allobaculum sp. Allo2]|uniref:hypothetical protein n=1 Tax=Allobaculum sp. Allo2 TaxID=2853432 RepID=UPI001F60DD73|nr:hypothetical protein [Allobaculum sp. Allo2]UNT93471.1 hypothetical protein KWG61_01235 [Allobaculum sp. Allo2]
MKAFVRATDGSTESTEDLVVYECPHCGAEIVTDKTTSATTCLFCKTPLVIEKQTSGKFAPKYVVPFEIDKKRLGELYEQYIAKSRFIPMNTLRKMSSIKSRAFICHTGFTICR